MTTFPPFGSAFVALLVDLATIDLTSTRMVLMAGFVIGLVHALDPDHLAAISTMVCKRRSLWRSALIGGWWGIGHTLALLAAGVLVILLQFRISLEVEQALEFGVAIMLVGLGLNVWWRFAARRSEKKADNSEHAHSHARPSTGVQLGWRPLLIGLVHGMAGSAALLFLTVGKLPVASQKFLFLAVFGMGSIGGMMLMSALLSLPVYWTAERFALAHKGVRLLAGGFSLCLGAWMAYRIGYVEGLFVPRY
jgi:ABC-type nickel/cobalt efflux system permease component RcnA